jgi:hypothetical protein
MRLAMKILKVTRRFGERVVWSLSAPHISVLSYYLPDGHGGTWNKNRHANCGQCSSDSSRFVGCTDTQNPKYMMVLFYQ